MNKDIGTLEVSFTPKAVNPDGSLGQVSISFTGLGGEFFMTYDQAKSLAAEIERRIAK